MIAIVPQGIHLRHCSRRSASFLVAAGVAGTGPGAGRSVHPHLTPSLADACLRGKPVSKLQTTGMVAAASTTLRQPIRSARDTMIPSGPRT